MEEKIPEWARIQGFQFPDVAPVFLPYSEKAWMRMFGVNDPNLQMTNIGSYSIAKPHIQADLVAVLHQFLPSAGLMVVTETHGGVGGFTKILAENFRHVNSCEILPQHCQVIENNMKIFGRANVSVVCGDYAAVGDELEQDVIISDPPWGGPSFHNQKYIRLGVGNVDITYIINRLFRLKKCRFFILFAPYNFDIPLFRQHLSADLRYRVTGHKHKFIQISSRSK